MTIILRYVYTKTGYIEKQFVGLIALQETNASTLTDTILRKLQSLCLDINDCRGQGYDNGANMVGVNSGVKTKILPINPRAFFAACGCHN
jgi:predicted esterase